MTPSDFRAIFPEFADTTVYTDSAISAQMAMADAYTDPTTWDVFYTEGVANFVAHRLAMGALRAAAAAGGAIPGLSYDATYKMVGSATVMYDAVMIRAKAQDEFMYTTYGQKFAQLARRLGTGALTLP